MPSLHARILVAVLIFLLALGGALLLLRSPSAAPKGGDTTDRAEVSSAVWKLGDAWTVRVRQDAGQITPEGKQSIATIPFRFKVVDAPSTDTGVWVVQVTQDGAEGPFAAGWRLHYRAQGTKLVLHRVAVGAEPPLEAELATIVLGPQFPYEVSYSAPPKDRTHTADDLIERSALPPGSLPNAPDNVPNATPPKTAPPLPEDGSGAAAPAPQRG